MVKDIVVNFPSNVGDAILSFPALDRVHAAYPGAKVTAIVSAKNKTLIAAHHCIDECIVYDKHWRVGQKISFCRRLRGRFQLIIDFKHSLLPFLLNIPFHTPLIRLKYQSVHRKDRNCELVNAVIPCLAPSTQKIRTDQKGDIWKNVDIKKAIFISTRSNSRLKTYPIDNLVAVARALSASYPLVCIGHADDSDYYQQLLQIPGVINLAGKTDLVDVCYLLKEHALLLLSSDTSILHLASYLDVPTVALFGPTDPNEYGPWSNCHTVIINDAASCRPCKKVPCSYNLECMKNITPQTVIDAVCAMIGEKKLA